MPVAQGASRYTRDDIVVADVGDYSEGGAECSLGPCERCIDDGIEVFNSRVLVSCLNEQRHED